MDRNELAARFAVAQYGDGREWIGTVSDVARHAVEMADALLAALTLTPTPAPVAPPAGPCPGEDARDDAEACKRIAAAGLAVPPPATAGEGPASIARRAIESVVTGWDATMIDEAVARVVGATPAPEAKRPEWVRVTKDIEFDDLGKGDWFARGYEVLHAKWWDSDGNPVVVTPRGHFGSLKPGEWEPAPCPPPVAGSAEDDVERAARALVENRGATYSVATNPPSKFVMIPSAYFEALRAALSRPVRP